MRQRENGGYHDSLKPSLLFPRDFASFRSRGAGGDRRAVRRGPPPARERLRLRAGDHGCDPVEAAAGCAVGDGGEGEGVAGEGGLGCLVGGKPRQRFGCSHKPILSMLASLSCYVDVASPCIPDGSP